jgi:hypothetical protein
MGRGRRPARGSRAPRGCPRGPWPRATHPNLPIVAPCRQQLAVGRELHRKHLGRVLAAAQGDPQGERKARCRGPGEEGGRGGCGGRCKGVCAWGARGGDTLHQTSRPQGLQGATTLGATRTALRATPVHLHTPNRQLWHQALAQRRWAVCGGAKRTCNAGDQTSFHDSITNKRPFLERVGQVSLGVWAHLNPTGAQARTQATSSSLHSSNTTTGDSQGKSPTHHLPQTWTRPSLGCVGGLLP